MQWRLIVGILLIGVLLGGLATLGLEMGTDDPVPEPPASPITRVSTDPALPSPQVDFPPVDPSLDGQLIDPPQSLPPLSADRPPQSAPTGSLPPLPPPGAGPVLPDMPVASGNDTPSPTPIDLAAPAPAPVQDLSPPRGHAKLEQQVRKINGVSSLAWGEAKTLHILVRNASPGSVAQAACSRANALGSDIRVHVQSVSDPNSSPAQRAC